MGPWTYLAFVHLSFVICAMCIHVSVVNSTIDLPWLFNAEWIFLVNNFLALFCWPAPIGASNNCCRSQQQKLSIFQAGAIFQTNIVFQHFCWVRRVLFSRPTSNYATINWIPACQNAVEMDKIVQSFGIKLDCKSFRIKNAACCTPHNVQNSWRQRVIGIIGNSAL